jgi:hypothetical protein
MATIITINGTDTLSELRVALNQNFENINDDITAVSEVLDTDTKIITANSMVIERGVRPLSTTILAVEASATIGGNLTIGEDLTVKDITSTANSTVTFESTTFNIEGTDSSTSIEGDLKISNNFILFGYDIVKDGSYISNYEAHTGDHGELDVEGINALTLNFANYSSLDDPGNENTIKEFTLLPATKIGQNLTLVLNTASSTGKPHKIRNTNILGLTSGQKISFNSDYCTVDFVWMGSGWLLKNLYKGEIV